MKLKKFTPDNAYPLGKNTVTIYPDGTMTFNTGATKELGLNKNFIKLFFYQNEEEGKENEWGFEITTEGKGFSISIRVRGMATINSKGLAQRILKSVGKTGEKVKFRIATEPTKIDNKILYMIITSKTLING